VSPRRATKPKNGEWVYTLPYAGLRVPGGGVTRQGVVTGVVPTDLQSLVDCQ
jgi:hypothetical protein